jgi:hypothetical protein
MLKWYEITLAVSVVATHADPALLTHDALGFNLWMDDTVGAHDKRKGTAVLSDPFLTRNYGALLRSLSSRRTSKAVMNQLPHLLGLSEVSSCMSDSASRTSAMSNPSVNQSCTSFTSWCASARRPSSRHRRPRLIAARNSSDFAC